MTIPPEDDFRRLGTQRFADELEPLEDPAAKLAPLPDPWVAPDGEPISSHPSHLLAREAQPSLVSSGWNELDAQAFISHLDRKALHASRDRNFTHAWIKPHHRQPPRRLPDPPTVPPHQSHPTHPLTARGPDPPAADHRISHRH